MLQSGITAHQETSPPAPTNPISSPSSSPPSLTRNPSAPERYASLMCPSRSISSLLHYSWYPAQRLSRSSPSFWALLRLHHHLCHASDCVGEKELPYQEPVATARYILRSASRSGGIWVCWHLAIPLEPHRPELWFEEACSATAGFGLGISVDHIWLWEVAKDMLVRTK